MPSIYYLRSFLPNFYYHIYNRGSRKEKIFLDEEDYNTFLSIISYYTKYPAGKALSTIWINAEMKGKSLLSKVRNLRELESNILPSFSITAYCLMPNHFHFLIRQNTESDKSNSISNFMRRLTITYSMYFQNKYNHSGNLFQGKYKNISVTTDNQLIHLSKYIQYIHRNPLEILKGSGLEKYTYSSYLNYIGLTHTDWVDPNPILQIVSKNRPFERYRELINNLPEGTGLPDKLLIDSAV